MKKLKGLWFPIFMIAAIILNSCNKSNYTGKDDLSKEIYTQQEDLKFDGDSDYEKFIVNPLIKLDDCKYIVAGTIEYRKGDEVIAVVDFGDGTCDNIATKTIDGKTFEFKLDEKDGESKYTKVITVPIIKLEDCEYIVAGLIDFYEDDVWVASIDFGDGTCDEWATKIWDGGSEVFSMAKN